MNTGTPTRDRAIWYSRSIGPSADHGFVDHRSAQDLQKRSAKAVRDGIHGVRADKAARTRVDDGGVLQKGWDGLKTVGEGIYTSSEDLDAAFHKSVVKGTWSTVRGVRNQGVALSHALGLDDGTHPYSAPPAGDFLFGPPADPEVTIRKNKEFLRGVRDDPGRAGQAVIDSFVDPVEESYRTGGVDEAIYRGVLENVNLVGKLGKLGDVSGPREPVKVSPQNGGNEPRPAKRGAPRERAPSYPKHRQTSTKPDAKSPRLAEDEAREDAAAANMHGGRRARYRGMDSDDGNHVHVDYINKHGRVLYTVHYPWRRNRD